MPELPEVETVCRGLEKALVGDRFSKVTLRRENLRFPFAEGFAEALVGRTVEGIQRRAKYILMTLEGGVAMIAHLGMSGSFRIETAPDPANPPDKHDHVIFETEKGMRVRYHDPRRFGFMLLTTTDALDRHPQLAEELSAKNEDRSCRSVFLSEQSLQCRYLSPQPFNTPK